MPTSGSPSRGCTLVPCQLPARPAATRWNGDRGARARRATGPADPDGAPHPERSASRTCPQETPQDRRAAAVLAGVRSRSIRRLGGSCTRSSCRRAGRPEPHDGPPTPGATRRWTALSPTGNSGAQRTITSLPEAYPPAAAILNRYTPGLMREPALSRPSHRSSCLPAVSSRSTSVTTRRPRTS